VARAYNMPIFKLFRAHKWQLIGKPLNTRVLKKSAKVSISHDLLKAKKLNKNW